MTNLWQCPIIFASGFIWLFFSGVVQASLDEELIQVTENAPKEVQLSPPSLEDILIEDFEEKRRDWTFEGTAFSGYGSGNYWHPGRSNHGPLRIKGFRGQMMLKSWGPHGRDIDIQIGRAISSPFIIERKFLRFLLSGGHYPGRACVNLLVDGNAVASITGQNSHVMESVAFDLSSYQGRQAQVEVLDRVIGPWGHVCMDMLIQTENSKGVRTLGNDVMRGSDFVWTRDGLLKGSLKWADDGSVMLDGKVVDLDSVKSVLLDREITKNSQTLHAVGMRSGEFWHVTIQKLYEDGKLGINNHHLFGTHNVDLTNIASLEFAPGLDSSKANRPGVLYRTNGRPLPGKLVWLKHDNIALDSPLGIIPLPRKDLHRYLLPSTGSEIVESMVDEVGLLDGTILRGEIDFDEGKILLSHSILKELKIEWKNVRYLVRAGNGISWLTDLERLGVESVGPLGKKPFQDAANVQGDDSHFLSSLRVSPQTTLRYKLTGVGAREFRAVISPIAGSRGDATVILVASGKEFYRQNLSAGDESRILQLPLPQGDDLELRVEFGKHLAYPCGIHLGDAQIAMLDKPREVTHP